MRASSRPRCTSTCRTRLGARSSMACTACRPYTYSLSLMNYAQLSLGLRLRGVEAGLSPPDRDGACCRAFLRPAGALPAALLPLAPSPLPLLLLPRSLRAGLVLPLRPAVSALR